MLARIGKLGIYLVGYDDDICLFQNVRYALEILTAHYRTCRIVRERQDKQLCLVCYLFTQLVCCQTELVFSFCLDADSNAAAKLDDRAVAYKARLNYEHFVARLDHAPYAKVDALRAADRHDDLVFGVIVRIYGALEIL